MAKPKPIRSILDDTLKGLEIGATLKTYTIFFSWKEIVGEAIARQTQPRSIRSRLLFLDVSHSTWMQHLQFLKPSLLEKITDFLGEPVIQDIRFKVGPIPQPRRLSSQISSWDSEPLDKETILEIEDHLQKIDDEETKRVLRNVWIKGAKLERHRQMRNKTKKTTS